MAHILVIDDSASALKLAERSIAGAGHQVTCCLSACSAMEILYFTQVDVIVTDIYMPDMDGIELLIEMRRRLPLTPVIAVSGGVGTMDMLKPARLLGAVKAIHKPYSPEELVSAIDHALGCKRHV